MDRKAQINFRYVLPALIFVGIWIFFSRKFAEKQGMGGFISIGKSKAKTSFDEVAGVDKAKQELEEIIEFLKDPESYGRLGARMPKGVLLVSPPGTGKTLPTEDSFLMTRKGLENGIVVAMGARATVAHQGMEGPWPCQL